MQVREFPVRRRFYGYMPVYYGEDGEIIFDQDWSKIGDPTNSENTEIVTCNVCKIPMLTGAPIQLPPIGTQKVETL